MDLKTFNANCLKSIKSKDKELAQFIRLDEDLYLCPLCNTEVDVGNYYDWGNGECPTCGNKWSWQETLYYEGYHVVDTCPFVEWEKYSRK